MTSWLEKLIVKVVTPLMHAYFDARLKIMADRLDTIAIDQRKHQEAQRADSIAHNDSVKKLMERECAAMERLTANLERLVSKS
jgi:uncharacterized protein (DUF3084 family)